MHKNLRNILKRGVIMELFKLNRRNAVLAAAAACFVSAISAMPALAAPLSDAEAMAQESWRESIARTATPDEGCYKAEYPSTLWSRIECVRAPDIMYLPHGVSAQTVGDGTDYAASVTGTMSSAVGSFPTVTGVTSERDGGYNVYSIQLNSNFMSNSQACSGRSGCLAWEQFVYSSSEHSAFMQYWLINYGSSCPSGWNTYSGDCWKNSAATSVPKVAIGKLSTMKLSGAAVSNGNDTLTFTVGTTAYSTTGKDTVTYLANGWNQSEFNIIGDGGGSAATFNKGSKLTVKVAVNNGTTSAPSCASNAGTTGETNNLTLGSCTATGGSTPYIQFTESN
jgi:hypothetical protein